jgi:nuclear GTP-binding protein
MTNSFGKGSLISLLRQFSSLHSSRKQISVGFIGYPNTGKSSIINTLRKKKVCTTAPIPGETKVWQYITLMKRIYLIDCPGIVPPSITDTPEDILLRGVVRVENVENPAQYMPAVLAKCKRHHLERTYQINKWNDDDGLKPFDAKDDKERLTESVNFLEMLARKGGRLLKGGEADMDGVAKMVLNDFLRGKIPWFSAPPKQVGEEALESTKEGSRDEKLGLTHKRKRDLDDVGSVTTGAADEEEAEEDDDIDDTFTGFDEEGEVSIVAGESDGEEDEEDEDEDEEEEASAST